LEPVRRARTCVKRARTLLAFLALPEHQPSTIEADKVLAKDTGPYTDRTYGISLYRVRNARVEEAVGAKTFKLGETTTPGSNK